MSLTRSLSKLSKKNTELNVRKKRLKEYQDERESCPQKFLSHMDANSALFSLENAKNLVKIITNVGDKEKIERPFCETCVEPFEMTKIKQCRFSNSSYEEKSIIDLNIEQLNKMDIDQNKSFFKEIYKHINEYCGKCNCERRAIVFCDNINDNEYTPNMTDCNNGFINETCYQICYPSSSIYFQHDPYMYENNEMSKNLDYDLSDNIHGNLILNADEMFLRPIFLSSQKSLYFTDLKKLMHYFLISQPNKPKGYNLSTINIQYSNFFEFFVDDKKNRAQLNYNEVHIDLLKWDGVKLNEISSINDENFNNENIDQQPIIIDFNSNFRLYSFEHIDYGALLYRHRFLDKPHTTILFNDQQYGPIIISIISETINKLHRSSTLTKEIEKSLNNKDQKKSNTASISYSTKPDNIINTMDSTPSYIRHSIIVRTSSLIPLRSTFYEGINSILNKKSNHSINIHQSNIINYLFPNFEFTNGLLIENNKKLENEILKIDETCLNKKFKVGLLYCDNNQCSEEEIYNNKSGSVSFEEFLQIIGTKVELKNFSTSENPKFHAQLDIINNKTGTHSIYTNFHGREIMFHVSTMLPFSKNENQQINRKRFIGNDIVVVVFQEPNALQIDPNTFHTQFTYAVICVKLTINGDYIVSVSRKDDVPYFGPPISRIYKKGLKFREFLLTKIINAEHAAYLSNKFYTMATRTRYQMLKNVVETNIITPPKNCNVTKFLKPKIPIKKPRLANIFPISPEVFVYNGVSWDVEIFNNKNIIGKKCKMIIAHKIIIFLDCKNNTTILKIGFSNIYFWSSTSTQRIHIFYKPNSVIMIKCKKKEKDEIPFILCRLRFLLRFIEINTIQFNRNKSLLKDIKITKYGVVSYVNPLSTAYEKGLRQNDLIVEINKIPILSLTYKQLYKILDDLSFGNTITINTLVLLNYQKTIPKIQNKSNLLNVTSKNTFNMFRQTPTIDDLNDIPTFNFDVDVKNNNQLNPNELKIPEKLFDSDSNDCYEESDIEYIFSHLKNNLNQTCTENNDNWTYYNNKDEETLNKTPRLKSTILSTNLNAFSEKDDLSEEFGSKNDLDKCIKTSRKNSSRSSSTYIKKNNIL